MQRIPNWANAVLISLVLLGVIWVVTAPTEPKPFTNKPVQSIEVKFLEERATRINLGRDSEMRLAVFAEGPKRAAIPVVCPRGFRPDPSKSYTVDGFGMTDETGRLIPSPVWILRNKTEDVVAITQQIPNVGEFVVKK